MINLYSQADAEGIRAASLLAAQTLDYIGAFVLPGISTKKLDDLCASFIRSRDGIPACLGYKGFSGSICTSINHVVCHGVPSTKEILKEGDIINIDIVVQKNGWHGDTSRMFTVGASITPNAQRLIETAHEAMWRGIEAVAVGVHLGTIGHAIQSYIEKQGMSVVREYCGHGVGRHIHEDPHVLHYGRKNQGLTIQEGWCFTIEPMVNIGSKDTRTLADGWTVVTADGTLSAQWEHTIYVGNKGVEVLTDPSKTDRLRFKKAAS